jgi:hypothetical protein
MDQLSKALTVNIGSQRCPRFTKRGRLRPEYRTRTLTLCCIHHSAFIGATNWHTTPKKAGPAFNKLSISLARLPGVAGAAPTLRCSRLPFAKTNWAEDEADLSHVPFSVS